MSKTMRTVLMLGCLSALAYATKLNDGNYTAHSDTSGNHNFHVHTGGGALVWEGLTYYWDEGAEAYINGNTKFTFTGQPNGTWSEDNTAGSGNIDSGTHSRVV